MSTEKQRPDLEGKGHVDQTSKYVERYSPSIERLPGGATKYCIFMEGIRPSLKASGRCPRIRYYHENGTDSKMVPHLSIDCLVPYPAKIYFGWASDSVSRRTSTQTRLDVQGGRGIQDEHTSTRHYIISG